MKKTLLGTLAVILLLALAAGLAACAAMGGAPDGNEETMYEASRNYQNGTFINPTPVNLKMEGNSLSMIATFLFDRSREPKLPLPMRRLTRADFTDTPGELQATWLGHSSCILELDGVRLLIDPVFGNASPVPFTVNRFQDAPISREDLPRLDAVVISHDHYDHLEMKTIKALMDTTPLFIVPLGVGARLKSWGCPEDKIIELDWWQECVVGDVEIVATPSRHFSGRGLGDRFKTLWASFAFKGPKHSAFYSGDGGYDTRFQEIGERLGPFDLTMIEIGAWDKQWLDVHLLPEQSIKAHTQLGGKYMLPVHWAAYDLAYHKWDDPILRASEAAEKEGVTLLTPTMGERCIPGQTVHREWWLGLGQSVQAQK